MSYDKVIPPPSVLINEFTINGRLIMHSADCPSSTLLIPLAVTLPEHCRPDAIRARLLHTAPLTARGAALVIHLSHDGSHHVAIAGRRAGELSRGR